MKRIWDYEFFLSLVAYLVAFVVAQRPELVGYQDWATQLFAVVGSVLLFSSVYDLPDKFGALVDKTFEVFYDDVVEIVEAKIEYLLAEIGLERDVEFSDEDKAKIRAILTENLIDMFSEFLDKHFHK